MLRIVQSGKCHAETGEPSDRQVEAAARAWLEWQFPGRCYESAGESMKDRFRDGARHILRAAAQADQSEQSIAS